MGDTYQGHDIDFAGQQAYAHGDNIQAAYPANNRWDIEIPDVSLIELFEDSVRKYPDRPALYFKGTSITYKQMGEMVDQAATGLLTMDLGKGKRIGMFMPNTPYYPIMFFAAMKVGATIVNYAFDGEMGEGLKEQVKNQIAHSKTDAMFTLDLTQFHDMMHELQKEGHLDKLIVGSTTDMLPYVKGVLANIFNTLPGVNKFALTNAVKSTLPLDKTTQYTTFTDLTKDGQLVSIDQLDPDDIAVLQYTSGTTSNPKGVMLTHRNLIANILQSEESVISHPERPCDKLATPGSGATLCAIPFFHVFGMTIGMLTPLKLGSELLLEPNPRKLNDLLKTIEEKRPILFPTVPLLLEKLAAKNTQSWRPRDLSSLKYVISGGASLPLDVKVAFEQAVGTPDVVQQGYGMSEASPVVSWMLPAGENRGESVGQIYPQTECKITALDNPDDILKIGENGKGMIWVRGPQVMKGYLDNPDATAKVMDKDGWYCTGDVGYLDEQLFLHVTGREKRIIIVNGHNVNPEEVETLIAEHPDVAEVCVAKINFGTDNKREGGKAFIRYKDGAEHPTIDELKIWMQTHLDHYQMPMEIEIRSEALPVKGIGKPDYRALEEQEVAKRGQTKLQDPPKP